ncbi:hypothetical protein [Glaciihabitans sp. UYNi722]|uniref:hypothetical protein n=1 Tax=Glaciihabitans sp. UYNi722 TaxID=3156344 RepID=UPI003399AD15
MTMFSAQRKAALVCALVLTGALAGCSTGYHGHDSGIDGVLWRQVASFEDPLSPNLFDSHANEPGAYLDALGIADWDGTAASVAHLGLEDGGVALYDITSTDAAVELSVFISSGSRSDGLTDEGHDYKGPSAVITCYGINAHFRPGATPLVDRIIFDKCPAALVKTAPKDAAFASGEVFDG